MQKQILILPFVLLYFCLSLDAQSIFSFGVKAGANFSTFSGKGAEGSDALIAPHAGGLVNFAATNADGFFKYVVQAEILYSMQGVKSGNDKTTLSYINVPIMVQRYIDASGFYIETGPQAGFLIGTGTVIGLIVALMSSSVLRSALYEVNALDAPTFAIVTMALAIVAFAASYIPALRATRADPMIALSHNA